LLILGCGVFTKCDFDPGDFLLEYRGEIISAEEGERRLEQSAEQHCSFLYFFESDKRKKMWLVKR